VRILVVRVEKPEFLNTEGRFFDSLEDFAEVRL
jgi:hypothetical protein